MSTQILKTCSYAFFSISLILGIIRHDMAPEPYIELANEPQFEAVGEVFINGKAGGSCVLIDQYYVLTAAHGFINRGKLRALDDYSIVFGDETFSIDEFHADTYHFDVNNALRHDLFLIKLDRPCLGIEPAKINRESDELHSKVVGVGYGQTGYPDDTFENVVRYKLAGQNVIDSIGGPMFEGHHVIMYCDFDHPNNSSCNKLGTADPEPLEYICAGGDSGGGMFRSSPRGWELIGICKGHTTDLIQFTETGFYGQIMRWTRVSAMSDWIDAIIN